METLKQTFNRRGASIAAMARYVAYAAVLSYSQWHISVKDSWTTLTSWDQINVTCAVVLNMLVAIGAVTAALADTFIMYSSWLDEPELCICTSGDNG